MKNILDKMSKVKPATWVRTILWLLTLINAGLTMVGKSPLPFKDEQVTEVITIVSTFAASAWAWWKNNSFTEAGHEGDKVVKELKGMN